MRYVCLACDFDGTLACDGQVPDDVIAALTRVTASGRNLILVTGRRLDDLFRVFAHVNLFDYIVCENGALLYKPSSKITKVLAAPPPKRFVEELCAQGVDPEVGRVIVSTWHPAETKVLEIVQQLETIQPGLET